MLCSHNLQSVVFQLNGATFKSEMQISAGGVARNIADVVTKLYGGVNFISAVGADQNAKFIRHSVARPECTTRFAICDKHPTANFSVIFDQQGDCKMIVGTTEVFKAITPDWVRNDLFAIYARNHSALTIA